MRTVPARPSCTRPLRWPGWQRNAWRIPPRVHVTRPQVVGLDFAAGMLKDAASRQQAMEEDLPPQRRPRMQ